MKKISKELLKNYNILISIFILSYIIFLLAITNYLDNNNRNEINIINKFFIYEFEELQQKLDLGLTVEYEIRDMVDESPRIEDIFITVTYNGEIYSSRPDYPNDLPTTPATGAIEKIGFYDYYILYKKVQIENKGSADIKIIKKLDYSKRFILNVFILGIFIIVSMLLIAIYISRKFYKKFMKAIINIQNITKKIDINSFESNQNLNIDSKNEYFEFESFVNSYNDMLLRLEMQIKAQTDFVNISSHELKTPIFILRGYADMLTRWGKNDEKILEESLDAIKDETINMENLVTKLLFLAKNGNYQLDITTIEIKVLLEEIIENLKLIYPNQEINLNENKSLIFSDHTLLKLLFTNLIENGIKYGNSNPIYITISNNIDVKVTITDHGIGIKKENIPYVFDKFFREDKSRERKSKSYGLGLTIVKNIVDTLNYTIEIDSEENVGTTVIVTMKVSP